MAANWSGSTTWSTPISWTGATITISDVNATSTATVTQRATSTVSLAGYATSTATVAAFATSTPGVSDG